MLIPMYRLYAKSHHTYGFKKLKIAVRPGIFNPILFHSTIDLIEYIESQEIKGKKLLDLGCGSGMTSVYFAKKSWKVTATDINPKALQNAEINAANNKVQAQFIESDLFEKLDKDEFDLILINPPYFPKDAKTEDDKAWYCGSSFNYFVSLFFQLKQRHKKKEQVYMVLSDRCELSVIKQIASEYELSMELKKRKSHFYEDILIFKILN